MHITNRDKAIDSVLAIARNLITAVIDTLLGANVDVLDRALTEARESIEHIQARLRE